ncbi:MAG: SusD/RagB family nutrient-binding outer membrane lipoprotein [Bacteroidales bacterium]|nr:SusD/RagB family nutrient-binding outer membrane lipoprotein [Bacteroidales bacterium]
MKKTIYSILIAVLAVSALWSCSNFDDMAKNPYALDEPVAPAEGFIHPIMFKTQYNLISIFRNNTIMLMQYGVSINSESASRVIDNYAVPEGTVDDVWTALYPQLGNAMAMYNKAVKENNGPAQAISLILQSFLITHITDTYGDVPFTEAGRFAVSDNLGNYTTAYDTQKSIYCKVVCMLEDANSLLSAWQQSDDPDKPKIASVCDLVFGGDLDLWRRFGNSLYARVLMRIAMKVVEEDNGILTLGDDKYGSIGVQSKLGELYACWKDNAGKYPQMNSRDQRPMVHFSAQNEVENTPFYSWTGGNWHSVGACDMMVRQMLDYTESVDNQNITVYKYKASTAGGHAEDPRYDCFWRKAFGMPPHLMSDVRARFVNEHVSSAGNSQIGRLPNGDVASGITAKVYNLKNADYYPMMQYSELAFIYAEAGARGWIPVIADILEYQDLLKKGVRESILEWNPYVTETSNEVTSYLDWVLNGKKWSGSKWSAGNALEAILTEKWIASYFMGIESWCDYRRTGYPLLKTNGPAAANDQILPTRMRYPSDEQYRNAVTYKEALDRWLGGENNLQTDVWWASTAESYQNRLKGRQ